MLKRPSWQSVLVTWCTTALASIVQPAGPSVAQQIVTACPNRPGFQTGAVAAQNLLVGGGQPTSGYTWTVTPGYTLPPGIALDNLTGAIHGNGNPASIPAGGSVLNIPITVTDQISTINSTSGMITLQVQAPGNGDVCGLPIFQVLAGPIPLRGDRGRDLTWIHAAEVGGRVIPHNGVEHGHAGHRVVTTACLIGEHADRAAALAGSPGIVRNGVIHDAHAAYLILRRAGPSSGHNNGALADVAGDLIVDDLRVGDCVERCAEG